MRNTLYMKALGLIILVLVIAGVAMAVLSLGKHVVKAATSDNALWEQTK